MCPPIDRKAVRTRRPLRRAAVVAPFVVLAVAWTAQAVERLKVAVGTFELPDAVRRDVSPKTLTDLLLLAGRDGLFHETVAPTAALHRVIERRRVDLTINPPAADAIDQAREGPSPPDLLLLPSLSRLGDQWVMTANVIDLGNAKIRPVTVEAKGDAGVIRDLVRQLWREIDRPAARAKFMGPEKSLVLLFGPDGSRLFSPADGFVRVWKVPSGEELASVGEKKTDRSRQSLFRPRGYALISPDAKWAATTHESAVWVWDVITGRIVHKLAPPAGWHFPADFSADGRWLATKGRKEVFIWDRRAGSLVATLGGLHDFPTEVRFSPEGSLIATAAGNSVRVWDVKMAAVRDEIKAHKWGVKRLTFRPDGKMLASVSDKMVHVWELATRGGVVLNVPGTSADRPTFSPDSQWLVSVSWPDNTVPLWHSPRPDPLRDGIFAGVKKDPNPPHATLTGQIDSIYAVAFSPDSRLVATGSKDGTVRLWDVKAGEEKSVLREHRKPVWTLAFSLDGKRLATGSEDGTIIVWDFTSAR